MKTFVRPRSCYRLSPRMFLTGLRTLDLAVLLLISALVSIKIAAHLTPLSLQRASAIAVLCSALLTFAGMKTGGAYRSVLLNWTSQIRCISFAICIGTVGLCGLLHFIIQDIANEKVIIIVWSIGNVWILCVARLLTIPLANRLHTEGRLVRRIALFGTSELERSFVRSLRRETNPDIELVGIYNEGYLPPWVEQNNLQFCGGLDEIVADVRNGALDVVVVGPQVDQQCKLERFRKAVEGCSIDIFHPYEPIVSVEFPIAYIGHVPVRILSLRPLSEWQVLQKVIFDRTIAALLLVIMMPLLMIIAILIKSESSGPVIFCQPRVGFNNNIFICLKFRTMYISMCDLQGDQQAMRYDPRVTQVGRWLRRLSLDELPQLLNVIRGDMSLVGPRPHPPSTNIEGRAFAELLPGYTGRHRIIPGITGWAQINGWRGPTVTKHQLEQRVLHDIYYMENWSLKFDLYILFLTLFRGFSGPQAF